MASNEEILKNYVEKEEATINKIQNENEESSKIINTHTGPKPWETKQDIIDKRKEIGWDNLKIEELPTQGLFYPAGTKIAIRAATGQEIRHWSTINEDDLSGLDDMLNYIIERCATITFPNQPSTWKDIKEVDRFYILLAIRERTFKNGENKLQVKVSETETMEVTKEMIDYIDFNNKLMEYYDPDERLIILKFKNGKNLKITLPSVGVVNWIKHYVQRKTQQQEPFDQDFINFAPFIILDWRMLNDDSYEKIVIDSQGWSTVEVSMLTKVRDIFTEAINPVVKYKDEQGGERQLPLNFLGGIKSLFLISDPFSELI